MIFHYNKKIYDSYSPDMTMDKPLYLTFPSLDKIDFIKHGFSTRLGGVSQGPFESMNLGYNRGDNPDNVTANYKIFTEALGIDMNRMVFGSQTHTTNLIRVTSDDCGKGINKPVNWHNIDGLATNDKEVYLSTLYADCSSIYFVDPVNKAVALSHAGWRGTLNNMAAATVEFMNSEFGTKPADLVIAIGPSIHNCCFEVGYDVAEFFKNLPDKFIDNCITQYSPGGSRGIVKFRINLQEITRRMLIDAGVLSLLSRRGWPSLIVPATR